MSRQKSTNAVESGLFKNLNNTLYGLLIVKSNKPEISTVVDGRLVFQQFHENVSQNINVNPFACSENIRNYANKKYEEEIVTASSLGEKGKIEKEYRRHILYADALYEKEKRAKRGKRACSGLISNSKMYVVNESYNIGIGKILNKKNTAMITSIEHLDDSYSIKTVVGNRKKYINVNTRYVGGVILMHAKISIASFIHDIMELFMEKTMSFDTKLKMVQMGIENIYCSLTVTDTDSCSFQINGISRTKSQQQTQPSEDEFLEFIENTIYRKLNHRIDTSSEYFDKFSLRDVHRKKKMGLFALEQDGTKSNYFLGQF